jgi:hypothetical protein
LVMTSDGAEGGVLSRAASKGPRPEDLRDDLLEMALRGLAYSREKSARARIAAIAEGEVTPAPGGRALRRAAERALDLLESLAPPPGVMGDSGSGKPGEPPAPVARYRSATVTTSARSTTPIVDHTSPMTDSRLRSGLVEAPSSSASPTLRRTSPAAARLPGRHGADFQEPGDGLTSSTT